MPVSGGVVLKVDVLVSIAPTEKVYGKSTCPADQSLAMASGTLSRRGADPAKDDGL